MVRRESDYTNGRSLGAVALGATALLALVAAARTTAAPTGSYALFQLLKFQTDVLHDFHLLSFAVWASWGIPRGCETPIPKLLR